MPISALEGTNTDELLEVIKKYLPEGPQYFPSDMITDQPERQIAAEIDVYKRQIESILFLKPVDETMKYPKLEFYDVPLLNKK